jgi:signal transduction histidine kinase
MPALFRIFALLLTAALPAWPQEKSAPLTRVAEVRALGFAAAAAGQPVALEGVVTYLRDQEGRVFNFNLNDGTGGVMVYPSASSLKLQPGQQVSLTGTTRMSVHGLRIEPANVTPGAVTGLPQPERISMAELSAGTCEGRYVEIEGTVRVVRLESVEISPQRLALDFGPRQRRVTALITHYQGAEARFVPGAALRLRGVPVRWTNARGQPLSVILMMNRAEDAVSLGPPAAPLPQSLAEVQFWSAPEEPAQRVSTSGIITFIRPDAFLVIQEGSRAVRIKPAAPFPSLTPGTRVDVRGFPVLGEYTLELEDALISPAGPAAPLPAENYPDAAAVLARQDLVDRDARLISLPATLRESRERDGLRALELTSGGKGFTAWLPPGELPDSLVPGAVVEVTGICTLHLTADQRRTGQRPGSFSLHLSGPDQIRLLQAGPWWDQTRLFRALAGIAALAILAFLWATLTSRKNARLHAEIARRERAEHQLATDRRRVAADLHDTLEQTLIAANLQLNAASRTMATQPEAAASRVGLAHQLVSRGRQEVRDAVWDLHAGHGSAASLHQLLESTCQETRTGTDIPVHFTCSGEVPPLPVLTTTQAVRFVREAITNALKHASPDKITVHLSCTPQHLTLTLSDNGCGFDPDAAPGPETGHFGLSSMKERLQRAGGSLTISSQPGQGTLLTAHLPLSPA